MMKARSGVAVAALAALLLTSGCSPAQSRLPEFQTEGERVVELVLEAIPVELLDPDEPADISVSESSRAFDDVLNFPSTRDLDEWVVWGFALLAHDESTPGATDQAMSEAIAAITEALKADGWSEPRSTTRADGRTELVFTKPDDLDDDQQRRFEVRYSAPLAEGEAAGISVTVRSPTTPTDDES